MNYPTIEDAVGHTPLVRLQRLGAQEHAARGTVVLAKLEGNNPAGSVKDRAALWMIRGAEARGEIKPGDTLIEATSGNTGIALAMAACVKGYRMILIMPEDLSVERAHELARVAARPARVRQRRQVVDSEDQAGGNPLRATSSIASQKRSSSESRV